MTLAQEHSRELILVCKNDLDQAPGVNKEEQVLHIYALRLVHEVDNFSIVPPTVGSERTALRSHQETESCQWIFAFKQLLRRGDF